MEREGVFVRERVFMSDRGSEWERKGECEWERV